MNMARSLVERRNVSQPRVVNFVYSGSGFSIGILKFKAKRFLKFPYYQFLKKRIRSVFNFCIFDSEVADWSSSGGP